MRKSPRTLKLLPPVPRPRAKAKRHKHKDPQGPRALKSIPHREDHQENKLSKKRIHELAKEYGMTGKDLAGKLRDLGFTHVKSHMTALDEFEELSVQGVLEAHGYSRGAAGGSVESDLGAGVIC